MRNATSNDSWGPSTQDMQDISRLTYESHELFEVMDMLDKRMNDKGKNWRHVLKALTVLDYIIHAGSENVVLWAKDNLYIIKTLREFQYIDDSGRDQGASVRAKAKDLTELIQDDDRLREERLNRGARKRRHRESRPPRDSPPYSQRNQSGTSVSRRHGESDSDFEKALEESRMTAEEEERRRKQQEGTDADLRKAIALSEEEERNRHSQDLFASNNASSNLIDTDFSQQPQQQMFTGYQQQQQQPFYTGYAQQQQPQYDVFGNPIYPQQQQQQQQQNALATGMLQNAYATGNNVFPQYTGYQQQQQPLFSQNTGYSQIPQQQTQQAPEPLQPLKTGSNNPFAPKTNSQSSSQFNSSFNNGPSLAELQQQQQQQQLQQQQQQQAFKPNLQRRASRNFDEGHMNELNTLLATGEGIDTFGNVGDLRIPAQHTKSSMINSAGIDLTRDTTGSHQSSNPFFSAQYTGIATTNQIQPAYTGYGFGNAPQSQQRNNGTGQNRNTLIDY